MAAGNYDWFYNRNLKIISPAKGYNNIVVGNVDAKENYDPNIDTTYPMNNVSAYVQAAENEISFFTNKPDISAPGTLIHWFDSNYEIQSYSGTSFSAPMVTGVVAQLHQAVPSLMSNPTKTKALILAGADPTIISNEDNPTVDDNNLVYKRSGLGMLNAVNSVNAALEGNFSSTTLNLRGTTAGVSQYQGTTWNLGSQYLRAGEKVRVVLTFNKPETWLQITSPYHNNIDLVLQAPNGSTIVAQARSTINNVEVLEYTAPTSGEYNIMAEVIAAQSAAQPVTTNLEIAVAWTTTHNHIYNVRYEQLTTYPAHSAYCICGKSILENHSFISGPVGTYCQKCYYISSYN